MHPFTQDRAGAFLLRDHQQVTLERTLENKGECGEFCDCGKWVKEKPCKECREMQSKHADLLNALDEMQQSVFYAGRRHVLAEAERVIVEQEAELVRLFVERKDAINRLLEADKLIRRISSLAGEGSGLLANVPAIATAQEAGA